uniref:Biotin/lipoyl attachment domain-containing protein n=1 Tax=Geobacter sp. (strain M21) TaxID=443144 RepID=C6DYC5_GEOSM
MQLTMTIDGKKYRVDVEVEEGEEVRTEGAFPPTTTMQAHPVYTTHPTATPPLAAPTPASSSEKICRSPIAGVVFKIVAQVGQHLEMNDLLVVLEAMKMETNITAHMSGKVEKILVSVGEAVQPGQAIAEFA